MLYVLIFHPLMQRIPGISILNYSNMKLSRKWTWEEIKNSINDSYSYDSTQDSWGVQVIYRKVLLQKMYRRLLKKSL